MKYVITYMIHGEPEDYQKKLIKTLSKLSGEMHLIEKPIPSHMTLKSPFETEQIKEVEKIIKEFTVQSRPFKFKIKKFGNFRKFVAFLKPTPRYKFRRVQKNLLKSLKKISWLEITPHDKSFHPHATLAYGNSKNSFAQIWRYLKSIPKPDFEMEFNNISIMKKSKGLWKPYKEFEIK